MAQLTAEITLQPDEIGKDVKEMPMEKAASADEPAAEKPAEDSPIVDGTDSVETSARQDTTADAQASAPPSRPSLVPLGSTHVQPSLSASAAPHPKRFSAVNINKKFLEKNTVTGSSTINSSTSSSVKVGNTAARQLSSLISSHPKLVTAKLTAGPAVSSTPTGWSRSPSVAPSPAPATNSPNSTSPLPSTATMQGTSIASQPPHISKLIQPQPRTAAQLNSTKEPKPVWGNIKPPAGGPLFRTDVQSNDFPTAAEVANAVTTRKQPKLDDAKLTPKPPSKQLRSEEADTFRGVHLDPNAHHWDEMEEDDDNFLDGVIEFGDGRQYKVNTSDPQQPEDSANTQAAQSQGDEPSSAVSKDERFVDDFDRSWPRSKGSPSPPSKEISTSNVRSASPKPLPGYSPREYPRVLFNERSNRLEPYSHSSHRQGQGQGQGPFGQKRSSISDGNAPDSLRGTREGPHNIQVLRKGSGNDYPRSRRFSGSSGGYPSASNGFGGPHREGRRDGPPPSPRMLRDQPSPFSESTIDRSRRTSMGPPPLPPNTSQRGHNRQLPPHLSPESAPRRLSSRDSQLLSPLDAPRSPSFTSGPPQSPSISLTSISPHKAPYASLPGNTVDMEEIRKDVMHNAAERAKARRQHEEEEREAQKERARLKAAEIEERIKSEKAKEEPPTLPLETEVNAILEAALEDVKSVEHSRISVKSQENNTSTNSHPPRRPSIPPRTPITASSSTPQAESWRARNPSSPKQNQGHPPVSDLFSASGPSAVEQIASIADSASDLEVVDFAEMGKFIGVSEPSEKHSGLAQATKAVVTSTKPPRPSASDFFDDSNSQPDVKSADFGAWRKKVEVSKEVKDEVVSTSGDESNIETVGVPEESTTKEPLSHLATQGQTVHVPIHHMSPRSSLRPQFSMSALDDTMSRIKGVLVGMHANDTPAMSPGQDSQSKKTAYYTPHTPLRQTTGRWVPPAMRARDCDDFPEPQDLFSVTIVNRPTTPPMEIPVSLPTLSRPFEAIHKRQLLVFHRPPPPARLDILTFDPPIPDMRRTWLINDVLFRSTSASFKSTFKYRVVIPTAHIMKAAYSVKLNSVGAFGRPNVADGVTSWRKPLQAISTLFKHDESILETGLDTTTRSPPPESKASEIAIASIPKLSDTSSKSDHSAPVRTRQPKMPEGSAVAFMRDSRIDFVDGSPRPLVNFIVGSELEDSWAQTSTLAEPGVTTTSRVIHSPMVPKVELKQDVSKALSNGSLLLQPGSNKEQVPPPSADGKISNDPVADGLATPPSHQSPWTRSPLNLSVKDSPSRAPDPEHLKAVWSQPSSKADIKPVNSLEAIADDLTPLPFVLPDVKSSEGTTPSPSLSSAPSRMSIHEVTRAFQQVPTSAAAQLSRDKAQISPPTTNAPVARPPPANTIASYPYPAPQNNIRPMYAHYPSPMLTHSPAPVLYSPMASPVQNRAVNGHPAMYNTWIAPQSSPTMMRSMPPSYPPMMPYSTGYNQPGSTNLIPIAPQPQGGRPVGMPVMSPVLSPIQPHPYGGSPVLMHQNHGYMPMPADRVQPLRTDNGHLPQHPHSHSSTHAGFNPGPSSPFTRPW